MSEASNSYLLKDCRYKDDTVLLVVDNGENEMKIRVSIDSFYSYGLRINEEIEKDVITLLLKEELYTNAYQGCIRKLTYKDRTEKEMRDYLEKEFVLEESTAEKILADLKNKHYIDDERYAQTAVNNFLLQLLGPNWIRRELKKRGIEENLIEEQLEKSGDGESVRAYELAQKLQNSQRPSSIRKKQMEITTKLMQKGYDAETARSAVSKLNFVEEREGEIDVLRSLALKARNRYGKKYGGSELRNRVYRYLSSQGFAYDDIYLVLNEMERES